MDKAKLPKALISAFGVLGTNDVLPYGRYKSRVVGDVLSTNARYICWMIENTSLVFSSNVRELAAARRRKRQVGCPHNYGGRWSFPDYDHDTLSDWGVGEFDSGGNMGFW